MARPPSTNGKKNKAPGKKKTRVAAAKLETLQKQSAVNRDAYGRPARTRRKYEGYVKNGRQFLAEVVEEKKKERESGEPTLNGSDDDEIDLDILARAFDGPPNELSATALEYFLVQKCCTEGLGMSTAWGIHGAFCDLWDHWDGTKYSGDYLYDEENKKLTGCPARAPVVQSLLKVIKNKSGTKGAAAGRHHAEAMKIEELRAVIEWSEKRCAEMNVDTSLDDHDRARLLAKHLEMEAFLSSGYTLWTRNFELCNLQFRDIVFGCNGPAPLSHPFFSVFLENRKGWQNKQGWDGPLESNTYHIYKQDLGELDMFSRLPVWVALLEHKIGRKVEDDDYVFPYIAPNGILHPKKALSHDQVQCLLTEFCQGAGLVKNFTTHCLRRGGAQYRFIHAPIGKRWSLTIIRWWGGWAEGEQVDTLMKYLIDSLQSYEKSYCDMLCPTRLDTEQSFMGEHQLSRQVTLGDMNLMGEALLNAIKANSPHTAPFPECRASEYGQVTAPRACETTRLAVQAEPTRPQPSNKSPNENDAPALFSHAKKHPRSKERPAPYPIAGALIPNLRRGPQAWRQAVEQWDEGVPSQGVPPLKDWPSSWYTGRMRLIHAAKRGDRETIAKEYARFGRDDESFLSAYPVAVKSIAALVDAIRGRHGRRRCSKNGTYEERSRSSPTPST